MQVIAILGLLSFLFVTYGQDFNIPTAWRVELSIPLLVVFMLTPSVQKPTTTLSKGTIVGMAQSVVNSLVPLFGTSGIISSRYNRLYFLNSYLSLIM